MKVKLITCWFNTSYAVYANGLRKGLEKKLGNEVGIIASNCGCHDPMDGVFFNKSCDFFEFPHIGYWRSTNPVKRWLRLSGRQLLYRERAKKYLERSGDADVLHFQQTLNAYGSLTVFNWLKMPSSAAKVVTVHELDPYQEDYKEKNLVYNLADRIIVHAGELRKSLIDLGVDERRIDVIEHGVDMGETPVVSADRSGIIFFGGHKLNPGKGLDTLCHSLARVRQQLGADTPRLKVFGYYGDETLAYGRKCAADAGVTDLVVWLNRLEPDEITREFQNSVVCALPFVGSFAGMPAGVAMANGVPVIATRRAGLPEHLGDAGLFVETNDVDGLTAALLKLLRDPEARNALIDKGYARAKQTLTWDAIAEKTLRSYEKALEHRRSRAAA